jgi:hypothetical protein
MNAALAAEVRFFALRGTSSAPFLALGSPSEFKPARNRCQAPPKLSIRANHNKIRLLSAKINLSKPPFNYLRFATLKSARKIRDPGTHAGVFLFTSEDFTTH